MRLVSFMTIFYQNPDKSALIYSHYGMKPGFGLVCKIYVQALIGLTGFERLYLHSMVPGCEK